MSDEVVREIKEAISDVSDRIHDSTEWWSSYYADEQGRTLVDQLVEKILRITQRKDEVTHD